MRLTDLDATFIGGWAPGAFHHLGNAIDGAQGVLFQCPKCASGLPVSTDEDGRRGVEGVHYVLIWFNNPRNAERVPDSEFPGPGRWTFAGDSLATLSLSPSVNLDVHPNHDGEAHPCTWHGWVQQGDAR